MASFFNTKRTNIQTPSRPSVHYGSITESLGTGTFDDLEDDDNLFSDAETSVNIDKRAPLNKRWSVYDKFNRRHYCRIRSCSECLSLLNLSCLLATTMLVTFVVLTIFFTRTILLNTSDLNSNHYDFIVIGSGPAGSVITNKLVKSGASVLLLEAGSHTQYDLGGTSYFGGPVTLFDIPMYWSTITSYSEFHWSGFNLPGVVMTKGLGGCGINNAMIYIRTLASDIVSWNIPGWNWETMQQHFLELEDYADDSNSTIPNYHKVGGNIKTSKAPHIDNLAPKFVNSAIEVGINFTPDFNAPNGRKGVGYYDFNIRGGVRDSAARQFLGPLLKNARNYPNFDLQVNAVVSKILLNPLKSTGKNEGIQKLSNSNTDVEEEQYQAYAVEYIQNNQVKTAYLKSTDISGNHFGEARSVISTCGTILSPKLLMNSGIGPKEVLHAASVPIKIQNENVGKHIQDHPAVGVIISLPSTTSAGNCFILYLIYICILILTIAFPNAYSLVFDWQNYVDKVIQSRNGKNIPNSDFGILASPGLSAGAFLVSPYSKNDVPDIQLTMFPSIPRSFLENLKIAPILLTSENGTTFAENQMLITVALLDPDARYEVVIDNNDPIGSAPIFQLPKTLNSYFSDTDLNKLAWGVEQVRKIVETPPLSDVTSNIVSPPSNIQTTSQLKEWIAETHHPNAHWVGSAKMGLSSKTSVLDGNAKVHGVKNLYVGGIIIDFYICCKCYNILCIDASAIPISPTGNIHATVVAVALQIVQGILRKLQD